jgi:hypothetical protein
LEVFVLRVQTELYNPISILCLTSSLFWKFHNFINLGR